MNPRHREGRARLRVVVMGGISGLDDRNFTADLPAVLDLGREVLEVPDSHELLILTHGAREMFRALPLSFIPHLGSADYLVTGPWSELALRRAEAVGVARAAYSGELDGGYVGTPEDDEIDASDAAFYLHYTSNNTRVGSQYHDVPAAACPRVVDMSSDLLSRPIPFSELDLVYSGTALVTGTAGLTVVIARRAFLDRALASSPLALAHAGRLPEPEALQLGSLRAALRWLEREEGLWEMERRSASKAALLYTAIDYSDGFYHCPIMIECRSLQTAALCFRNAELESRFRAEATAAGLVHVGPPTPGRGILVPLFNSVPMEQVEQWVDLLEDFRARH